jgi:DNA-binding cell septation regulator SpoVG
MHIAIKWFEGDRPQFNVALASKEDRDPFLEIKGVRIVNGSKGEFVSWPATKNEKTGKFWNHCYGSDAFNEAVLEAARAAMPKPAGRPTKTVAPEDDDIPF